MVDHFTTYLNSEERWDLICSELDKNKERWLWFIEQANKSEFKLPIVHNKDTPRDVLNRWKNSEDATASNILHLMGIVYLKRPLSLLKQWVKEVTSKELYEQGMQYYFKALYRKAVPLFEESSKLEYPYATLRLYQCHLKTNTPTDLNEECMRHNEWFLKQAVNGHAAEKYMMAIFVNLVEGNPHAGIEWNTKALELDPHYGPAQEIIGLCYEYGGSVVIQDKALALEWYKKAADNGYLPAIYYTALAYRDGDGTAQDLKEAKIWFQKAAEQGHILAQYEYAFRLEADDQNYEEAFKWYEMAAEQGDSDAQVNLAVLYFEGKGVPKSDEKSVYWYRKAAEQGDADAQHSLGAFYASGSGVPRSYEKAVYWYEKAANQNQEGAQYQLACCYMHGKGVEQNTSKAVLLLKELASNGNRDAQCELGVCYFKGEHVKKNYQKAFKYFEKAAMKGQVNAQCNLGMCYDEAKGIAKDSAQALKWFLKAAENNHPSGMAYAGHHYLTGNGAEKNIPKGLSLLHRAAELGHKIAMFHLGKHYMNYYRGEALEWFEKAVELKHAPAARYLGNCYYFGMGTKQDFQKAVEWYQKSIDLGSKESYVELSRCYEFGEGVAQDFRTAMQLLKYLQSSRSRTQQKRLKKVFKMAKCNKQESC